MDHKQKKSFLLLGLALLVMLSCNMPGVARPTETGANAIYTAAAQTVAAQLTQVSQPPATQLVPTFAPPTQGGISTQAPPTATPSLTSPPATSQPTATTAPTQIPRACDAIRFVKDVTYPDNTLVEAGAKFVKTWRLRNDGTCTWSTGYALVYSGGDNLGAPSSIGLPQSVAPGDTVDISVSLTAPDRSGTYRAEFKLRNSSGGTFGLGDDRTKPFWAQIKVAVQTGLTYDFLIKARDAEWISSVGSGAGTALSFGGADDDPNGVAKIKDAVTLETGATSGKILLTYPKRENNGAISGLFPAYSVQNGDILKGKLGFMMNPGGGCGSGKVKFQIVYKDGGAPKLLQEWTKTCTGNFTDVSIDLSWLKGKNVQFGLVVWAEGAATDDWAIWNSLRIVNE